MSTIIAELEPTHSGMRRRLKVQRTDDLDLPYVLSGGLFLELPRKYKSLSAAKQAAARLAGLKLVWVEQDDKDKVSEHD